MTKLANDFKVGERYVFNHMFNPNSPWNGHVVEVVAPETVAESFSTRVGYVVVRDNELDLRGLVKPEELSEVPDATT